MDHTGLLSLSEPGVSDIQNALRLFDIPSAPTLLDDTSSDPTCEKLPYPCHSVERASPAQRCRKSVSNDEAQAKNRESQSVFAFAAR